MKKGLVCISLLCLIFNIYSCKKEEPTDNDKPVINSEDKYYSLKITTNNKEATNYSVNVDNLDKIKEGSNVTISNTHGYYKIVQIINNENGDILTTSNKYTFKMNSNLDLKLIFKYDKNYYIESFEVKEKDGQAKIILMAGQSNMMGQDSVYTTLSVDVRNYYTSQTSSVLINNNAYNTASKFTGGIEASGVFENVRFGLSPNNALAPEIGFAKYLSTYDSSNHYYLVKVCQGGTNLAIEWNPDNYDKIQQPDAPRGQRYMYRRFVNNLNACIETFKRSNIKPVIKGMCWFQGENDSENQSYANNYATNIVKLQNDIKTRYAEYIDEGFKWISAGISTTSPAWTYEDAVNSALKANSDEYISQTETLPRITDGHYTAESYLTIGQLFGMKYLGLDSTLEYTLPIE